MRIALLLAISCLTAHTIKAQESATPVADSLRAAGDLRGAALSYSAALRTASDQDAGTIAYALASTHALAGQFPDSAFHYLDLALETEESMAPLYDPDFWFLVSDPRWASVEDRQLDRLATQVGDGFDREYARVLLAARLKEWAFRWHIMFGFRTLGPDSPILSALAFSMQEHHAQNEEVILDLLDTKGWPALSAVGEEAAYTAGNLVNHGDLATRQKYLPMVEAACEAGESDWSDYAHILDRTELELGRPQVYGTQMEMNEATGNFEPRLLLEPDGVNARRLAKGMEPIEAQLERFNAAMKRDFGGN